MIFYGDGTVVREALCGDVSPPTIYLDLGRDFTLYFFSNEEIEGHGWTLHYDVVPG